MYTMIEEMMTQMAIFIPIIFALEALTIVFSLLFMHYSAKHRNHKLSAAWYICGFLFGIWTVIAFLIKRKDFPGENFKVCGQCGAKYPANYEICSRCLIELPEVNAEEKAKEKKLSKIFGAGIIVTYVAAFAVGIAFGATTVFDTFEDLMSMTDRIAVEGVFYDKMGNSYENAEDVLLYDAEGRVYTYTAETINEEGYSYEEYYYVRDDGEKYFEVDCYVTADGWFYCDKGALLESYYPDTENMTEEELDEYYKQQMEMYESEYKYYFYPYADKNGNLYYAAYEASWNEKGELITAENDVVVAE